MNIFSRVQQLFSRKSAEADNAYPGTWTPVGGGADGVNERNLLANHKEWVFIAVDKVASSTAAVRLKVMRYRRNGDDTEVFEGPLVDFLEAPGADYTGKDFVYLNTVYKELTGNAFWERVKGKKIDPLIPTLVSPVIHAGKLIGYKYSQGGTQRTISRKDMLHDRYIDPARPFWGAGKLQKIARWVDISSFSNELLSRFFKNGAVFGGFIETEEESQERIALIKAGLQNDHVGVENFHKWGVLPKGSKATRTTGNMAEMEMGETDDRYRDKILATFGVPKTLVGLTTEVNRASAEAAEYVFARYTIKPIVDDLIEFLNVHVAPTLDISEDYYFAYDEFVPVNMEHELKEREIALNKQPYMTVNEVRAKQGLPPAAGGDVIYAPPFQVPLGTPTPLPEPGDDEEDEADPPKPAKGRPRAVSARMRRVEKREDAFDDLAVRLAGIMTTAADPDEMAWKSFVGRVENYQEDFEERVRKFNQRQKTDIINRLNHITRAVAKTDIFDLAAETAVMIDVVGPLLRGLLTEQAVAEYEAQGFAGTFDSGSEQIGKIVGLAAKRLAKSYNTTTLKLLKTALNTGITEGDSLDQLTKRVNDVYEYSNLVRAKATAHTESFYIANKGSQEAYRQSGVVKSQRWYTSEDERVCPHCEPMNGTVIGVDKSFFKKGETMIGSDGSSLSLNYRAIDVPPLHTNCRCFVRPEEIEID